MAAGDQNPELHSRLALTTRAWRVRHGIRQLLGRATIGIRDASGGAWNGATGTHPIKALGEVWRHRELIFELAFQKTIARYRSFFLGPLWIILGFAAFAFGLAFIMTILRERATFQEFVPYIVMGLFSWNIMIGVLTEGTVSLVSNRGMIQQSSAPILIYPVVILLRQVFLGMHTLIVVIPVLIFFPVDWSINVLWAIPGYLLLLVFSVSLAVMLAIVGAYFPDLSEIISSGLRFAFFFTPIMWMPEMRPQYEFIWKLNPLYYIVESVRGPVLGTSDAPTVMMVLALMGVITIGVATLVYSKWARGARIRA